MSSPLQRRTLGAPATAAETLPAAVPAGWTPPTDEVTDAPTDQPTTGAADTTPATTDEPAPDPAPTTPTVAADANAGAVIEVDYNDLTTGERVLFSMMEQLGERVDSLTAALRVVGEQQNWIVDKAGTTFAQFDAMMAGGNPLKMLGQMMGGNKRGKVAP